MKKVLALILALAMVMALAACGGGGETSKSNGGDVSNGGAESSEPGGEDEQPGGEDEQPGGEQTGYLRDNITVGISSDGGTLDPLASFVNWGKAAMGSLTFEGLISLDYDYNVYYEIAKEITQVDETHWHLEIWDSVVDTYGNKITIDDVIWGYQNAIDTGNQGAIPKFDHWEKEDDYSATMVLSEAFVAGDFEKHFGNVKVLSEDTYKNVCGGDMTTNPIGSGPYKLAENGYTVGTEVILEADENYWGIAVGLTDPNSEYYNPLVVQNFKTITYKVIQDASSRAIALDMGTVDVVDSLEATDLANLDTERFNLIDLPQRPPVAFVLNASGNGPGGSIMTNQAFRQAICYALDNAAIAEKLGIPTTLAYSIQPNQVDTPDSWKNERDYYNFDLEKCADLLEEAGYNGETITLMYVSDTVANTVATYMQSQLKAAGISLEPLQLDQTTANEYQYDATKWDLRLATLGGGAYVAQTIKAWWSEDVAQHFSNGENSSCVADEELDALYVKVNADSVTTEDIEAWGEYFDEKAYGYAICSYSNQTACSNELQSVYLTTSGALNLNAFVLAE